MAEYREYVTLRVAGVDLDDVVSSVSESSSRKTTPVHTMNRRRTVRGFRQGNNTYGLTIEAENIVDDRVPDWHALKDAGVRVAIVRTPNVGKVVTYGGVLITNIEENSSDGEASLRITAMAKTRR